MGLTTVIILVWWSFGAGVAATEYQLVTSQFNRPALIVLLASLAACIMGPFGLAFYSLTCKDCGQLLTFKFFGWTVYKCKEHE